jgi:hypothetical protein
MLRTSYGPDSVNGEILTRHINGVAINIGARKATTCTIRDTAAMVVGSFALIIRKISNAVDDFWAHYHIVRAVESAADCDCMSHFSSSFVACFVHGISMSLCINITQAACVINSKIKKMCSGLNTHIIAGTV